MRLEPSREPASLPNPSVLSVMFLILQLSRWPFLIPDAILMACKILGTCALPSSCLTLLWDLCPNKLIYVFSQYVPTVGFLLALILDHNNSTESQTSVHICAKICKVPKQLNWGSLSGQSFIFYFFNHSEIVLWAGEMASICDCSFFFLSHLAPVLHRMLIRI